MIKTTMKRFFFIRRTSRNPAYKYAKKGKLAIDGFVGKVSLQAEDGI